MCINKLKNVQFCSNINKEEREEKHLLKANIENKAKEVFTYQQYLECEKEEMSIGDNIGNYKVIGGARDNKHDKIFKSILQDKKELTKFLKKYIRHEVEPENIELCNTNHITSDYKYSDSDIICKIKGKETYYLIEQQTRVDYSMPYRMLAYSVEIIREAVRGKNTNSKDFAYPEVIPIVLYTGNNRWTAKTKFSECQRIEISEEKVIEFKYNLVDINKYEIEEILKERTKLSNALILEKCKNNEEVIKSIKKIIEKQNEINELKKLVKYLYGNFEDEKIKKIIEELEESESGGEMSTIAERLEREYKNEMRKSFAQGVRNTIEKLIAKNVNDEFITDVTGYSKQQIAKIRKELESKQIQKSST